jgi:recombination protein RecR
MDSIKKLTDLFAKFPTIGNRTAGRFVLYLLKLPNPQIEELINTIRELKNSVKLCTFCNNPFEGQAGLCPICQNPSRNRQLVCIVEKENDLTSIEHTKKYQGLYIILGASSSSFKMTDAYMAKINSLKDRIQDSSKFSLPKINVTEVILALNPTPEGKATSALIERTLKDLPGLKITHLAQGSACRRFAG